MCLKCSCLMKHMPACCIGISARRHGISMILHASRSTHCMDISPKLKGILYKKQKREPLLEPALCTGLGMSTRVYL